MSIVVIDTDTSLLFWTQTTTLDGIPLLLTFRYNSRESVYYLTIQSADASTTYIQGLKLVTNFPLLQQFASPPGEMVVISQSSTDDSPPALGELGIGQRCVLLYLDQATTLDAGGESWRNPNPTGI